MNILLTLKGLIYKSRINKLLNRTQTYLESLDGSVKTANRLVDTFDKSTAFISLKEHKHFIDRYMQNKVYLDKDDPFEVHKKIKQEFNKLHKWVLKTSKYKTIVQLYEQVQQESYQVYISTLEQLQIIQTHNSKYDKKINHALSELEHLKQDYITNSQKLHFAKEFEEVYCFFRQAGEDELSECQ